MHNIKHNALLVLGTLCLAGVSSFAHSGVVPAPEMDGALIGQVGFLVSGVVLIARRAMNKSKQK